MRLIEFVQEQQLPSHHQYSRCSVSETDTSTVLSAQMLAVWYLMTNQTYSPKTILLNLR
ncbi:hypothetical protein O9929_20795 [Vibrio lentus]|nr:hypothetical protein [Vibrio lentus]